MEINTLQRKINLQNSLPQDVIEARSRDRQNPNLHVDVLMSCISQSLKKKKKDCHINSHTADKANATLLH